MAAAALRPPPPITLAEAFPGGRGAPNIRVLQEGLAAQRPCEPELWSAVLEAGCAVLRAEPNVLHVDGRVVVVGPLRGHFYDLLQILQGIAEGGQTQQSGHPGAGPPVQLKEGTKWLFLGDFIDGAAFSSQVLVFLLALKRAHPQQVFLLRGRRETLLKEWDHRGRSCLLRTELSRRYGGVPGTNPETMWEDCGEVFRALPLAAVVAGRYWCASGGIGPGVSSPAELDKVDRNVDTVAHATSVLDVVWADPMDDEDEDSQSNALFLHNFEKGCSYYFSFNAVTHFLKENDLTCILRGVSFPDLREVPPVLTRQTHNSSGRPWHYQYSPFDPGYRCYRRSPLTNFPTIISLFSAPRFVDNDNRGAVLVVDGSRLDVRQFCAAPAPFFPPGMASGLSWSLPFVADRLSALGHAMWGVASARETDRFAVLTDNVRRGLSYDEREYGLLALQRLYKLVRRRERERNASIMYNGLAGLCYQDRGGLLPGDELTPLPTQPDPKPPLKSFYSPTAFPRLASLIGQWEAVRREALEVRGAELIPVHGPDMRVEDIMHRPGWVAAYQSVSGRNPKWRNFALISPQGDFPANCAACPETVRLLRKLSEQQRVRCAGFSLLQAQGVIHKHRDRCGVPDGSLALCLGVAIPSPQSCTLTVGGKKETHANGKAIVFDGTLMHSAQNDHAEEDRIVLYVDFELAPGEPEGSRRD